jgi:cell division protein ZapA (FtsZ GTPase activity inhibitor)
MDRSKTIRVQIHGNEYPVRADTDPEYTRSVAAYVDRKMTEIASDQSLVSSTKIAILAAIHIADELFQERHKREETMNDVAERALQISEVLAREL